MSESLAKRLVMARTALGLTQSQLAAKAGLKQQLIGHLEAGRIKNTTKILEISEALNVTPEWLVFGRTGADAGSNESDYKHPIKNDLQLIRLNTTISRITVRGIVQAGYWAEACEWEPGDQYQVPFFYPNGIDERYKTKNLFGLEVRGDSMDLVYPEGSTAICIPLHEDLRPLQNEDHVIVRRESSSKGCETTIKQLVIEAGTGRYFLKAQSSNPDYQGVLPLIDPNKPQMMNDVTITIVARVVTSISPWKT